MGHGGVIRLILEWIERRSLPPELAGDIATALSIWASIQRIEDHHDDASMAYSLAFEFVDGVDDPWILGLLNRKVALLLIDLKRPQRGLALLKEALFYFTFAGDRRGQAAVYIDLGTLLTTLGDRKSSKAWLNLGLEALPAEARLDRFAAYFALAWAHARDQQPKAASEYLAQARVLLPAGSRLLWNVYWLEGDLHLELGNLVEAAASYRICRNGLLADGLEGDAALAGFDLALALFALKDRDSLTELILQLLQSAKTFKRNRLAQAALRKLGLNHYRGQTSPELLMEIRRQLEAGLSQSRGREHQV